MPDEVKARHCLGYAMKSLMLFHLVHSLTYGLILDFRLSGVRFVILEDSRHLRGIVSLVLGLALQAERFLLSLSFLSWVSSCSFIVFDSSFHYLVPGLISGFRLWVSSSFLVAFVSSICYLVPGIIYGFGWWVVGPIIFSKASRNLSWKG